MFDFSISGPATVGICTSLGGNLHQPRWEFAPASVGICTSRRGNLCRPRGENLNQPRGEFAIPPERYHDLRQTHSPNQQHKVESLLNSRSYFISHTPYLRFCFLYLDYSTCPIPDITSAMLVYSWSGSWSKTSITSCGALLSSAWLTNSSLDAGKFIPSKKLAMFAGDRPPSPLAILLPPNSAKSLLMQKRLSASSLIYPIHTNRKGYFMSSRHKN